MTLAAAAMVEREITPVSFEGCKMRGAAVAVCIVRAGAMSISLRARATIVGAPANASRSRTRCHLSGGGVFRQSR
jgi:hypothetical protein